MTLIILWASFLLPWIILFFLDSKRVKRFISVAFFTVLLTSIFWQVAEILNWWKIDVNLPFLTNVSAFNYGLLPVITILVFYYSFSNAWLFFGINIIIDAIQAFIISPFLFQKFKLYHMVNMNNFGLFILLIGIVLAIYIYQKLYERQPL